MVFDEPSRTNNPGNVVFMKSILLAAAVLGGLAFAPPASAAQIVQTLTFADGSHNDSPSFTLTSTNTIDQFDLSVGTLTAITISFIGPSSLILNLGPLDGGFPISSFHWNNDVFNLSGPDISTTNAGAIQSFSTTFPSFNLPPGFSGTGTLDGEFIIQTLGEGDGTGTYSYQSLTEQVAYTYTPNATSAPEPCSIAVVMVGMVGLTIVRRRTLGPARGS
jgi:hypothetical protein